MFCSTPNWCEQCNIWEYMVTFLWFLLVCLPVDSLPLLIYKCDLLWDCVMEGNGEELMSSDEDWGVALGVSVLGLEFWDVSAQKYLLIALVCEAKAEFRVVGKVLVQNLLLPLVFELFVWLNKPAHAAWVFPHCMHFMIACWFVGGGSCWQNLLPFASLPPRFLVYLKP